MESGISNGALTAEDVPSSAGDARALAEFALSFDGYAHWGERCGERAAAAATAYRESDTVPDDLADLRACLFYEQQRWRWRPGSPPPDAVGYLDALLDAIRDRLAAG